MYKIELVYRGIFTFHVTYSYLRKWASDQDCPADYNFKFWLCFVVENKKKLLEGLLQEGTKKEEEMKKIQQNRHAEQSRNINNTTIVQLESLMFIKGGRQKARLIGDISPNLRPDMSPKKVFFYTLPLKS